ncbi:hypothetical protein CQ018_01045 [Arthrobacter sp. MYb227]|uniref:pyrimidine reductase family protein n=1 Tax=Arthrobacter sp. MYb227 TaxID=1848601 RepID=UPI000CFB9208|nr:pyrimidine reductase family protein [Arthrobacter sp. MYb227]PQZ95915.1 hypothetical protein CQ018_01045 [Arthrobacter sp. MYb227]
MQRIYPEFKPSTTDNELLESYRAPTHERSFVRFNFVSTIDGAATHSGLSGALGSSADHRVFALLRRLADVILVGAGTIRAEGYEGELLDAPSKAWRLAHSMTEHPVLGIVSGRLDLDPGSELFTQNPGEILILTSAHADVQREKAFSEVAEVLRCPDPTGLVDPQWVQEVLAQRGHTMIHAEGGPQLLGAFHESGAIDSLCLTISPLVAGGTARRISSGSTQAPLRRMRLHSLLEEDGNLIAEYRRGTY